MKLQIHPSIIELFPSVKLGLVVGRDINNPPKSPEDVIAAMRQVEKKLMMSCPTTEELTKHPTIDDWCKAYRTFGFKPNQHRSSVEALCRRVIQAKGFPEISTVVDIYNTLSVKHMMPIGGDDIDCVYGDIVLTIADGTEHFVMLGEKVGKIKKGEVVYKDDKEVLCRSWNYREAEKSKITEATKNLVLVCEGLEHTSKEDLEAALTELKNTLEKHCKGSYKLFFLDQDNVEASF
ncbi:MAG TPA: phenylalanine--tRNA ligase beta subunit-related protein [Amoebophilaceae bacterium]|jgi:lysyl-tRNA synthetase class 2|nr:phenylalanine--tRNA ligase beta subunit-related protein [Amoebophilaceae bacterium]